MQDDLTERSYRGQVFASKEARALYLASRGMQPQALRTKRRFSPLMIFAGIAALVVVAGAISNLATPKPAPVLKPGKPSEETLAQMATLINLNGRLCARVTAVQPIVKDEYLISCIQNRDGTGIATYELNAATGRVK
jgi:hypothetical protein